MSKLYVPQEYSKLLSVQRSSFTPFWTDDQGFAVWVLAGEDLVRGNNVSPLQAGANGSVYKVPTSGNNLNTPCSVVYADTYVGAWAPIVVMGIAYVLPVSSVTPACGNYGYCGTSEAGRAESSATAPGTASRAFCVFLDTGSGAGELTRALLRMF